MHVTQSVAGVLRVAWYAAGYLLALDEEDTFHSQLAQASRRRKTSGTSSHDANVRLLPEPRLERHCRGASHVVRPGPARYQWR